MISLALFPHPVMNFAQLASVSIVIPQLGGRRDQVLLGKRTPVPLHFKKKTGVSSHVYLFICCVSVLPLVALQIVGISWGQL